MDRPIWKWEDLGIDWSVYHPDAKTILDDPFFWTDLDDFSPHGNDTGFDVLFNYQEYRTTNPQVVDSKFFEELMISWGLADIHRDNELVDKMVDDALIGLAFAQLKIDGFCSNWSAKNALQAIARKRRSTRGLPNELYDLISSKLVSFAPDYSDAETSAEAETDQEVEQEDLSHDDEPEPAHSIATVPSNPNAKAVWKNIDPDGPVYIDARLSNGGCAFDSLPQIEGFPRWIQENEEVTIVTSGFTEILYKRATNYFHSKPNPEQIEFTWIYRVGNPRGVPLKAFITKGVRRSQQIIDDLRAHNADPAIAKDNHQDESFDEWAAKLKFETSKFVLEPVIQKSEHLDKYRLYLRAHDKKTGTSGQRLILESYRQEVVYLLAKIELKAGLVTLRHNPDYENSYRARGFASPMEIPLALVLQSGGASNSNFG